MSHTSRVEVVNPAWTQIFSGAGTIQIQLDDKDPVEIVVAQSTPGAGVSGIVLSRGELQEYVNNALEDGDGVYVRSLNTDKPSAVVWIGTGTLIT